MKNPYIHLEDEKLMQLYQSGEALAFDVIYQRHHQKVFGFLRKRLKDQQACQDVFQNTFVKLHRFRHNYDPKYSLLKWIFTICKSELLDYLKKPKGQQVELDIEKVSTPQDTLEFPIEIENEKSLTANEKKAIKLRYFSDEDFAMISKKLNTGPSNARKLVSRGIKKLKIKYGGTRE